jgi:hypothetical protein
MKFPRIISAVAAGVLLVNAEAAQASMSPTTDRSNMSLHSSKASGQEASPTESPIRADTALPPVDAAPAQTRPLASQANPAPAQSNTPAGAARRSQIRTRVRTGSKSAIATPTRREKPFKAPLVEKYFLDGSLKGGEEALLERLAKHPKDDQVRFGLGMLQFLRAVEDGSQSLYRYGLRDLSDYGGPARLMPIPKNPHPQQLTYSEFRQIVTTFNDDLARADATLSEITDGEVQLPLHFGLIKLDLTGDGQPDKYERFWSIYARASRHSDLTEEQAKQFFIKFDRADVHWLRGYMHVFMACCDMFLAYDSQESFNLSAHLFFTDVASPYKFLAHDKPRKNANREWDSELFPIFDAVALLHTIRWQLVEPARMETALHHWQMVTAQSKESWKWILAETDNDHEWLPNPNQDSVIPNAKLTYPMIESWLSMMEESRKLLAGETLIPFWRGSDHSLGINLEKFFLMPPDRLDFVLLVQGTDDAPYLEHGKITNVKVWHRLTETFDRNFPGFAFWIN